MLALGGSIANGFRRVKLPKSFVAVNLSDAFSFEEHEHAENDSDAVATIAEMTGQTDATEGEGPDTLFPVKGQAEEKPRDAGEGA